MKVILSISLAALVYVGAEFGLSNSVDYTGEYLAIKTNSKIQFDQLTLKEDGNFEYYFAIIDAMTTTKIIKGKYKMQSKELQLIPISFESTPAYTQQVNINSKIRMRGQNIPQIIDQKSPNLFKQSLAAFGTGTFGLKPKYHLKQINDQLSLCVLDLKTEQFQSVFLKNN